MQVASHVAMRAVIVFASDANYSLQNRPGKAERLHPTTYTTCLNLLPDGAGACVSREREHAKGYVDMLEDHFSRTCLSQVHPRA